MLNEQSSYLLLCRTVLYSLLQLSLWVMVFLVLAACYLVIDRVNRVSGTV